MRLAKTFYCALAACALLAGSASASDFSHECRSADGLYEMNDEELHASDNDQSAIPYETISDKVLSQRNGYCLSHGRRFEFQSKTYVRRVRIRVEGEPVEVELLCQLAADGLPAAYNCAKEVVTLDTTSGNGGGSSADSTNSSATWLHNGSVMRLEANGNARVFSYEKPRPGMRKAGARPGDVVFEGERQGDTYTGTAYIFSRDCGRHGYPVAGNVTNGDRAVVLEGQAPVLDDNCKIKSYRHDRLRFEYVRR